MEPPGPPGSGRPAITPRPQTSLTPRATRDLGLLALIWGGSFLAIQTAVEEVPEATAVAWRVVPAAALLWLVMRLRARRLPRGARVWGAFAVMGVLNNVLPFLLISWAQLQIETGLAAILMPRRHSSRHWPRRFSCATSG